MYAVSVKSCFLKVSEVDWVPMKSKARVIGTGSYLPEKVLSNFDLEKLVDTSDEWIVSRTGMRERRVAAPDEFTSHMGAKAALEALKRAGLVPEEIDYILVTTCTPDYIFPSTACLIQKEIGAKNAACSDLQAACAGFLYGLSMAKAFVESGMYKNVLLIASEKLSTVTDYQDRSTCILFGDGACACVVSAEGKGLSIESVRLGSDGDYSDLVVLPGGGCRTPASVESVQGRQHYIKMAGNELFKHAVRRMEAACKDCLEHCGVREQDVSWLVPHQANLRIIDAMAKRFEHLPPDRIYKTLEKYGNTSASSLGIALDELLRSNEVVAGEKILLTAFGGGLTWGAALLEGLS
jgi:3-oxoacyl-[acyl-carrier-protein] synthase-3